MTQGRITRVGGGSLGSPRHTETRGPGPVEGAGEVSIGHGPGVAATRVRPEMAGEPQAAASGRSPEPLASEDEE